MTDTPEAVRLADQIHAGNGEWMQKAAALLRRIPGLEADYQRLMDKYNALHINALHINALASRQRVAKLEAEVLEQARLNGMGAERELALMAQVSRLEAERDQLRAELEDARWQPIETAPKGQSVLLWATRRGGRCVIDDWGDYDMHNHPRITHWMPLPAAPTPPNADQKGAA